MKRLFSALAAALLGSTTQAQSIQWPPLPASEYIAGKVASKEDVAAGRAVFVAEKDGVQIGKPAKILIPQYAWHRDGTKKTPVVVIQAEDIGSQRILGAKLAAGGFVAGLAEEFDLLGRMPPKCETRVLAAE